MKHGVFSVVIISCCVVCTKAVIFAEMLTSERCGLELLLLLLLFDLQLADTDLTVELRLDY